MDETPNGNWFLVKMGLRVELKTNRAIPVVHRKSDYQIHFVGPGSLNGVGLVLIMGRTEFAYPLLSSIGDVLAAVYLEGLGLGDEKKGHGSHQNANGKR